ncbi:hypothetical protein FQA39_LY14327 [Lamprigera yunnana]|nr:hypothetical protein FQA39_LY14327 [Lamprigera yunnana]
MSGYIQIHLTNFNTFYTPGQEVTGRVDCNFTSEATIRAILVIFDGRCGTSWTESEEYYDDFFKENRTRYINCSGEELYFHQEINLTGISNIPLQLYAGMHSYNFSYVLPNHLPSSYESPNGWGNVRYTIKALIDRSWASVSKADSKAVAVLQVVSPLDLNYIPRVREPVEISVDKVLCSCFCNNTDPLSFTFTLPTIGYVPGQEVRVGVYVQNLTNASAQNVTFKITKVTEYICQSPNRSTKYDKQIIATYACDGIGAHSEKSWTAILRLPETQLYPNMVPCNLINITYKLKGEVSLPCPHTNLTASVPLTIGNVQIRDLESSSLSDPPSPRNVTLPNYGLLVPSSDNYRSYGATNQLPSAPELPPPSYEEVQRAQKS